MGATIASALNATAGQAIRVTARSTCVMACTSGSPWQSVPRRFHMKAMASSRRTSTPRFARSRMMPAYSRRTSGLAQLTSHWNSLKVVHTQPVELVVPREVAGGEVGEDVGEGALVGVGNGPVGVDVEVLAVRGVAGPGALGPLVLAGHVVEDEVEDEADAGVVEVLGEGREVVHRAEVRAHRAVVGHGVATVVVALPGAQQGHEVEVADAELAQVGQAVGHPAQVSGEALGVRGVPDEAGVLEPVGAQHPVEVAAVQPVGALRVRGVGELDEVGRRGPGRARCRRGGPGPRRGPGASARRGPGTSSRGRRAGPRRPSGAGSPVRSPPHSCGCAETFPHAHGRDRPEDHDHSPGPNGDHRLGCRAEAWEDPLPSRPPGFYAARHSAGFQQGSPTTSHRGWAMSRTVSHSAEANRTLSSMTITTLETAAPAGRGEGSARSD